MLSAKPWRTDALVRLFASVLICFFFLSTLALSVLQFFGGSSRQNAPAFLGLNFLALAFLGGALFILSRSWQLEKFMRNLAVFMICLYAALFLVWLAGRTQNGAGAVELKSNTTRIVVAIFSFQGAALAFVYCFLREHRVGWREAFGLRHLPKRAALLGMAIGLGAIPVMIGLQYLSGLAMKAIGLPFVEQEAVQMLRATHGFWPRAILGIAAILIAPVAEEILFRGLLYPAIKQAGHPRVALWMTSALFAAIHVNLATFVPLMILAMMLVWLYENTDNLLAPIAAHSLFNAANFIMLFTVDSLSR